MAIVSKSQLKNWFRNGLKPVQEHFWNWMDSFWHKGEKIPTSSIDGLESYFDNIASDLNSRAMRDASNISEDDAQKWRDLLGNIDSSKEILTGIEDPNRAEIAGEIGQFYVLKDITETVDIALYIFTGVDSIGWLNLGILTLEQARTNNNTVEGVILGSEEFDKEGNRNAFIQLSDLEDALSEIPVLTNDDNTLIIDEDIIRLNVTNITEEFTANGTDRNFEMTNVYASIENVFINGVRIKSSDYITISEQEIEIKSGVKLSLGDEVVIQGTMFIE